MFGKIKVPKFLSGSSIKIIAMISMFIDHLAVAMLRGNEKLISSPYANEWSLVYKVMRGTGRIAFPLFCFLLIEGFFHTSNLKKYLTRIGIFAIISEIPFNLVEYKTLYGYQHQNVLFTLFVGLITVSQFDKIKGFELKDEFRRWGILFLGCIVAQILHMDYGAFGIVTIFSCYYLRNVEWQRNFVLVVLGLSEKTAWISVIPLLFYNGKRGLNIKWLWYMFYPTHLFLLWGIKILLQI